MVRITATIEMKRIIEKHSGCDQVAATHPRSQLVSLQKPQNGRHLPKIENAKLVEEEWPRIGWNTQVKKG